MRCPLGVAHPDDAPAEESLPLYEWMLALLYFRRTTGWGR
jgi:hypothetical protein